MRWFLSVSLGALAALIPATTPAAGGVTVTLQPTMGYATRTLVATYSYTSRGTPGCAGTVTWSFGKIQWTQSRISGSRTTCASSTAPTPPPAGLSPGTYQVCGSDPLVGTGCRDYTILPPPASPSPTPRASPAASPSPYSTPSPSPTGSPGPAATPGAGIALQPSPSGSPGAVSSTTGRGGPGLNETGAHGGFPGWPWPDWLLLVAGLLGAAAVALTRAGWRPAGLLGGAAQDPAELLAAKVTYRSSAFPPDGPDEPRRAD